MIPTERRGASRPALHGADYLAPFNMRRLSGILFTILLTVLMICECCGCAAGSINYSKDKFAVAETAAAAEEYAPVSYDMAEMPYEGAAGAMAPEAKATEALPNPTERKLIKNVNVTIETKSFESTVSSIIAKAGECGGYVETNDMFYPRKEANRGSAFIIARIPVEKLELFLTGVEGEGNVTYKSENIQDITLQYSDTASRRNSLKIEQQRLDELMKSATEIGDIIALEERQAEVRYELESIESQLRIYDNQVEYSSVSINVDTVETYTPQEKGTFIERISKGFADTLRAVGIWLEDAAVWFISSLPALALVAAFIIIIVLIISLIVKKSKKKKGENSSDN